jgi:polar amino acid transport system substrate-binding protein
MQGDAKQGSIGAQDPGTDPGSRRSFLTAGGLAAVGAAGFVAARPQLAQAQTPPPPAPAEFAWGDGIRRIKAAGKIVIAMPGRPVPPQYYPDASGKPAGYDVEVANMIAKDLNVTPVFEEAVVAPRIIGLQTGRYDLVMGGTANSPIRAQAVAFTRGYVPYQQVFLVHKDSPIKNPDELNDPKYTISCQIGATSEYAVRERFPKANIRPLQINEAMLEVATGRAHADLVELYLARPFARNHPSVKVLSGADGKPIIAATEFGCLCCRANEMGLHYWLDNWLYWYDSHAILPALYERIVGPALRE